MMPTSGWRNDDKREKRFMLAELHRISVASLSWDIFGPICMRVAFEFHASFMTAQPAGTIAT